MKKINLLFPGGFKPVHGGHIMMMLKYLQLNDRYPEYVPNLYVIVSQKERDGINSMSTHWMLDNVFSGYNNFRVIETEGSPIRKAYNMTSMKDFGDGLYAMVSSDKDYDMIRCEDYYKGFLEGGKYFTEGVDVINFGDYIKNVALYRGRNDKYDGTPISSRVLREDVMNRDFDKFKTAYDVPGINIPEKLVKEYYNFLVSSLNESISEGGAAGHINHPYEDGTMLFAEIWDMIVNLFDGKIEDIKEKVDGINMFASVDLKGRTIFARNISNLKTEPMYLDDIVREGRNRRVNVAMKNGCETIDAIFKNIPDRIELFNYDDKLDHVCYRHWCNFEIIDMNCTNVIPYSSNYVSFHDIRTTCFDYNEDARLRFEVFQDPNLEIDVEKIRQAIEKTNEMKFKPINSPHVILKNNVVLNGLKEKYQNELDELMDEHGVDLNSSINDFKAKQYRRYILSKPAIINKCTLEEWDLIVQRLVDKKSVPLNVFDKRLRNIISDFEKNKKANFDRRMMLPLTAFFMNLGNDVIKCCDNLMNKGNEDNVVSDMKAKLSRAIDELKNNKDEKNLERLEFLLTRLGDMSNIQSSEGIVFKYRGNCYKLTGSFAVVNQIMNINRKAGK